MPTRQRTAIESFFLWEYSKGHEELMVWLAAVGIVAVLRKMAGSVQSGMHLRDREELQVRRFHRCICGLEEHCGLRFCLDAVAA